MHLNWASFKSTQNSMQDLQLQCKARENWENSDNHFIIHSHSFCLMRLLLKKSKGQCVNTNPNLKISRRPNKLTLEYQDGFFFIFQKNSAMATLGLKKIGKFLWKGSENVCPVSFWKMIESFWEFILEFIERILRNYREIITLYHIESLKSKI